MANIKKTYFLCPSFDCPPPPTGPIQLGTILTGPFSIDRPLGSTPPPANVIFTTTKKDWKSTITNETAGSVGLFAKFVQLIVGVGVEANVEWEKSNLTNIDIEQLETTYYNPVGLDEYLESALTAPDVRRFIEKSRMRKPVYIVTGLKIARHGSIHSDSANAQGVALGVSIDGTAFAAPVEVGPQTTRRTAKGESTSWGSSDGFVFAYRLSKICLKKKTGEVREKEHIKGALFDSKVERIEAAPTYELENVTGDQFAAEDFEAAIMEIEGDDEDCNCVAPSQNGTRT